MTHPQAQDDEALEAMRFAIMVEMFTTIPHELTSKTAARYATAALTARRKHEGSSSREQVRRDFEEECG